MLNTRYSVYKAVSILPVKVIKRLTGSIKIRKMAATSQESRSSTSVEESNYKNKFDTLFDEHGMTANNRITLITGAPGTKHLLMASEMLQKATDELMKQPITKSGAIVQYGPRMGSFEYRQQVAELLSYGYKDQVNSDNLVLTSGATYGLHITCTMLFSHGTTIFVEDPSYFIAIKIFKEDLGYNVIPVPTDKDGTDIEALDRLLQEHLRNDVTPVSDKRPFRSMFYVIPTYNNPSGRCLNEERSKKLIQLARKHNILLFCDDVYNLLHYKTDKLPPKRLLQYDSPDDPDYKGNVISNGTFSKVLSPGVRLGWIETGDRILKVLEGSSILWSGGSVNHYMSHVLATAIRNGWQKEMLNDVIQTYGKTMKSASKVLRDNLPEGCSFREPEGGYFLWVELPSNIDSAEVGKKLFKEHNVEILNGARCSPTGSFKNCIRISISFHEEAVVVDSVKKLCQVISDYLKENK